MSSLFRVTSRLLRISPRGKALLVLGVGTLAGCGGGAPSDATAPRNVTPVLSSLKVSLTPDTLVIGQTSVASASGFDQNSAAIGIGIPAWSSSSPNIATIDAGGVVSAVAPGRTVITASVVGAQAERVVTIVLAPIARLAIAPQIARVAMGNTLQLSATPLDYIGHALADRKIDWKTSDATKATVTSAGLVTPLSLGDATIIVTSEGVSASIPLTVTAIPDSVATITVSPSVGSLKIGRTLQLAATLRDSAGTILTGRAIAWSVSGIPGINAATVSASGLLTTLAPGTVVVEAFAEGQHGGVTIIVADDVDENIIVSFAEPALTALVGDTLRIVVAVKSANPLASVVAYVGPQKRPVALSIKPIGALGLVEAWVGLLDVTDLPTGPYQVLVTATDNKGSRGVGSTQFQRDTRTGKGGSSDVPKMK
ncbi:MAG: Ig-like domain-containing protein [bacterium]